MLALTLIKAVFCFANANCFLKLKFRRVSQKSSRGTIIGGTAFGLKWYILEYCSNIWIDSLILFSTDTGENVQKWTRVFSIRRWVILVARTRQKKQENNVVALRSLLNVFACTQVSSPRLYRLIFDPVETKVEAYSVCDKCQFPIN